MCCKLVQGVPVLFTSFINNLFINSLRIACIQCISTMFNITLPSNFSRSTSTPSQLCLLFFFYNLASPICGTIYWIVVNLKENWLSSPSQKSSVLNRSSFKSVGSWTLPISMLECWLIWSCAGNHSCCEFLNAVVLSCSEILFYSGSHFGVLQSLLPVFPNGTWASEEGGSYRCYIYG